MISNLSSGTYTVTVTDNIGCTKTASVTITQPTLLLGCPPSSGSICSGQSMQLACCPGSGGTPPYSYSWTPPIGLSSSTICNPTASPALSIVYTAIITDANGCTATTTLTIIVNPTPPTPVITQNVDTLFSNTWGDFFVWYLNSVQIGPPPSGSYYVTTVPGNYTVVAWTVEGCSSGPSSSYPYFPTNTLENIFQSEFSVHPNPASSQILVNVPAELKNSALVIYNILGNVVLKNNLYDNRNIIDISALHEGIYFASAEKNGRKIMVRFAVMK